MHETRLRNELGSERVKKAWPCVQVERGGGGVNSHFLETLMLHVQKYLTKGHIVNDAH